MFAYGDSVVVLRSPQGRDKFGDKARDVSHELHNVGIHYVETEEIKPTTSPSQVDNRQTIETDVDLYLSVGDDLLPTDYVELPDGEVYKVHGKILPSKSPLSGWNPGKIAHLKQIKG
ncbi:hypothetical protein [Rhodococcus sp. ACS1]|uniref:hypothetical protein n=1 Tax=Rhodococcus sp. ACS1 TaxID=2028570 RepID=UPI00117A5C9E|nr:hypothetical protein [Rhodococcus sp. ACS1]